jgi:hypothetical protein
MVWRWAAFVAGIALGIVMLKWRRMPWQLATVVVAVVFAATSAFATSRSTGRPWERSSPSRRPRSSLLGLVESGVRAGLELRRQLANAASGVERYRDQPVVLLLRERRVLGSVSMAVTGERSGVVPDPPLHGRPFPRCLGKDGPRRGVVAPRRAAWVTGSHTQTLRLGSRSCERTSDDADS